MKKPIANLSILIVLIIGCTNEVKLPKETSIEEIENIVSTINDKNLAKLDTLANPGNVNSLDSSGVSLLSRAVLSREFDAVELLIEKGAEPNLRNDTRTKSTPLMMCANYDLVSTAEYLIGKGAEIDVQDSNGDPVINWSAYMGELAFTKMLLDKGAKTDFKSIHSDNTMGVALKEWHDSIVDLLIDYGKGVHEVDDNERPLIAAVKANDIAFMKGHLNHENSNTLDEAGNSLLIIAANKGYFEILKILLLNHAEIDAMNPAGHTALNKAVFSQNNDIAKYLLANGADVNKANVRFMLPPLVAAARSNNLEMAKILLEKGADVNTRNTIDNFTPIVWASIYDHIDMVKLLLAYNPDLSVVSKYGEDIFQMTGNPEILKLLNGNKPMD
jgi:ankyrin repeat protein